MRKLMLFLSALLLLTPALYAEETQAGQTTNPWEISEAFNYQRGDFGTNKEIQTYEFDTGLKYSFEKASVLLTVPYLTVKSNSSVTRVHGMVQRVRAVRSNTATKSGIGDVTLNGTYALLNEKSQDPLTLLLYGYIKFPSASKSDGLGTGEFDEGPGIGVSKYFLPQWKAFTDYYYTFIGSPSGLNLRDENKFDGGVGYDLDSRTNVSLAYEWSNALVRGTSDPQDILLGLQYKLDANLRCFGSIGFGLNNNTPDQNITLGGAFAF